MEGSGVGPNVPVGEGDGAIEGLGLGAGESVGARESPPFCCKVRRVRVPFSPESRAETDGLTRRSNKTRAHFMLNLSFNKAPVEAADDDEEKEVDSLIRRTAMR